MSATAFFDYPGDSGDDAPTDGPTGRSGDAGVFLAELDDVGWDRLLRLTEVRRYHPGEVIVWPGSADRSLFIVADGSVEVAEPERAVLSTGAVFGESAFLDGVPHTAVVRAATDVDLMLLTPEGFEVLAARDPGLARMVLTDLGRLLSRRLRVALAAPARARR